MNNKILLLLFSLLLLAVCPATWAQTRPVSGTVGTTDGIGGFPGATVLVKGTAVVTATDGTGAYRLDVPAAATTLVFTAVGMQNVEEVIGERSVIDVRFRTDVKQLNEVVVTALGTKTQRDRFASSVATLDGTAVAKSGETSLLTGLSGKASGVLITRNGGDPGAGAYIQIRGQNTINGNIQPLFIIDGVPVSNASDNTGTGTASGNGIVQQSRINDLNPEDIERMEVLKGA